MDDLVAAGGWDVSLPPTFVSNKFVWPQREGDLLMEFPCLLKHSISMSWVCVFSRLLVVYCVEPQASGQTVKEDNGAVWNEISFFSGIGGHVDFFSQRGRCSWQQLKACFELNFKNAVHF